MPSTLLGDRKVGRPICEDRAYAEQMGVSKRLVIRLGGAKYLKRLPAANRRLLLKQTSLKGKSWGLEALGMTVNKPYAVQKNEAFELYFQARLRERGLSK